MIKKYFRLLLTTLLICTLSILVCCENNTTTVANIGDKAPDFTLENIDGGKISLSNYQNKTVLIVVRKVHCKGCDMQAPFIDSAFDKAAGKLVVLNVFKQEAKDSVKKHVEEKQLTRYPVLLDPEDRIAQLFGLPQAAPVNIIIDSQSIVQNIHPGPFQNENDVRDWID